MKEGCNIQICIRRNQLYLLFKTMAAVVVMCPRGKSLYVLWCLKTNCNSYLVWIIDPFNNCCSLFKYLTMDCFCHSFILMCRTLAIKAKQYHGELRRTDNCDMTSAECSTALCTSWICFMAPRVTMYTAWLIEKSAQCVLMVWFNILIRARFCIFGLQL